MEVKFSYMLQSLDLKIIMVHLSIKFVNALPHSLFPQKGKKNLRARYWWNPPLRPGSSGKGFGGDIKVAGFNSQQGKNWHYKTHFCVYFKLIRLASILQLLTCCVLELVTFSICFFNQVPTLLLLQLLPFGLPWA